MVDLDVAYATALVAALLLGIGFVLQQYTAQMEPDSSFLSLHILTDLLRKPRWLAGIGCMITGYLLAAWAIGHLELSLVEPLLTLYLLFALLLAVPLTKQRLKWPEIVGAIILCTGVALLSSTRTTKPIGLSFGSFSHWPTAAIIAGIAFVAVQFGYRRKGQVRATFTGLGAGLVFGIQDALTRQTLEVMQGNPISVLFTTWSAYALVGAGIVGVWLMQNAFSAAPLHASLPTIAAGEPAAGIVLGIVVFGDRIQVSEGMLAIEAGGIAALILGAMAVARSSAFSGLRRLTGVLPGGPPDQATDGERRTAEPADRLEADPDRLEADRLELDGPEEHLADAADHFAAAADHLADAAREPEGRPGRTRRRWHISGPRIHDPASGGAER